MLNSVRMVATAEHQYAGRRLYAGDEYDCEPQHVSVMRRLGWAAPVNNKAEEDKPKKRRYQRRDLQAAL